MPTFSYYSNADLLALLARSEKQAFEEIYSRYWQKLFVIAYNRLQDRWGAEDIVHDVFAGLWVNRHSAEIKDLENYLAVATKYSVFNRMKKELREREALKGIGETPVMDLRIEDRLYHRQVLERVREEVEKLPARCKLIFKYRKEEGLPVKEIAKRLDITPKTVENQITRAYKHLKTNIRTFLLALF